MKLTTVYQDLLSHPEAYEFLASVKLLRALLKNNNPFDQKILIQSNIDRRLLGPEIQNLKIEVGKAVLVTNSFALDALNGPLPQEYVQKVLYNYKYQDQSLYDFLSIFNNRLGHLLYDGHRKFKIGLNDTFSDMSPHGYFLKALSGAYINYPYEKQVPLRSLMIYTRLYWCRSRIAFRKILNNFFHIPVAVKFSTGRWNTIPLEVRTKIGGSDARYHKLGKGAALGSKFWDQSDEFMVSLGPVDINTYIRFLKPGDFYPMLVALIANYKKKQQYYKIHLSLQKECVPRAVLGRGVALGWTSWIGVKKGSLKTDPSITLSSLRYFSPKDLKNWYAQHGTLDMN